MTLLKILGTAGILALLSILFQAMRQAPEPETGYLVTVTKQYPYKTKVFSLIYKTEVDSLIKDCFGPAFSRASRLLDTNNHLQIITDTHHLYIERKEIKEIRNGEVILRRRKFKPNKN